MQALRAIELEKTQSRKCLFKSKASEEVYALIYVDSTLFVGNSKDVSKVERELAKKFMTTKLGSCKHILELAVNRSEGRILLTQELFLEKLVEYYGFADAKLTLTTLTLSLSL